MQIFYSFYLSNLPVLFLSSHHLKYLSLTALFKESPLCFVTNYTRENPYLLLYCVIDLPVGPTAPKLLLSVIFPCFVFFPVLFFSRSVHIHFKSSVWQQVIHIVVTQYDNQLVYCKHSVFIYSHDSCFWVTACKDFAL